MMGVVDHLRENRYAGLKKGNDKRLQYIPLPARKKIEKFLQLAAT